MARVISSDFIPLHPGSRTAERASDAGGNRPLLFGDGDDVALRLPAIQKTREARDLPRRSGWRKREQVLPVAEVSTQTLVTPAPLLEPLGEGTE